MSQVFFLRNEINDPLCLENSIENLGRVSPVFKKEKVHEQIGKHVVSKCKENQWHQCEQF